MDDEEEHKDSRSENNDTIATTETLTCINVPNGGIKISKVGGKIGLCFIPKHEWDEVKTKGEWKLSPLNQLQSNMISMLTKIILLDLTQSSPKNTPEFQKQVFYFLQGQRK